MNNLPPFYVGQKVVCIKTHSWGMVEKGNHYTVTNIRLMTCGLWVVSVGILNKHNAILCHCGHNHTTGTDMAFDPILFKAVDENFQSITLQKVIEIESPLINVN